MRILRSRVVWSVGISLGRLSVSGSRTRNVAPLPTPSLSTVDGAVVDVDQVLDDGQPDAEPGEALAGAGLLLAEALEDLRQEFRADAAAAVGDGDFVLIAVGARIHVDAPAGGRELDRVGEQVPDHLLQARIVRHHVRFAIVDLQCTIRTPFRLRLRADDFHRGFDGARRRNGVHLDAHLAEADAGEIQQVFDEMALHARVAFDGVQSLLEHGRASRSCA